MYLKKILFISASLSMMLLFSCNPCRNGKSCHRAGDRAKKQQSRSSKNNHKYQNSAGGFSL